MKYKRRKSASSKYIIESENKIKSKKRPKLFLLLLFLPLAVSLVFSHITPGVRGLSKTLDVALAVSEDAISYLADKLSFLSRLGEKGAHFCFDYIRNEEKDTALAVSSLKDDEKKIVPKDADKSPNEADESPKETENIFSPSLPCPGEISSPFGERVHPLSGETTSHNGIDLAVTEGTSILAIEKGVIEKSEYNQFSGNFIVIAHRDGYTSSYAHLSRANVKTGDTVEKGDVIGISGSTGAVTGPHLHMEIRKDGVPVDPMSLIKVN